jgi:RNA polymerase sigma factor (sigma-70 family)
MNKQDDLLARCKRGDPTAYTDLYREHAGAIYNTIVRLVKHTAEAEDILQESFVAAFQQIARVKAASGFRAWVKRIAINKSIDCIRKRKINFVELEPEMLPTAEEIKDEEAFDYTMEAIASAIELLPDHYRAVFTLYVVEDMLQADIAQLLGLEHATVRIQYFRAKQKLLQILTTTRKDGYEK